jgi:mRNA interferase RelE/StbE
MSFSVRLGRRAERSLRRIPASDARRILSAIAGFEADPFGGDVVKLKGTDSFRRRVGDYRVIFTVDFGGRSVDVLDVLRRTTTTYR